MPPSNTNSPERPTARPKFRIQEAILILRQGKSHPMWREAAWHLMEHAGKDTQLLLEAQSDLLLAVQPKPSAWSKYSVWIVLGTGAVALLAVFLWQMINLLKVEC
jgi:hypothetical protein